MLIETMLPELIEAPASVDAPESQDIFSSALTPEHAGFLAARADDGFTSGFDDTGANKKALLTEGAILHALNIINKVAQRFFDCLGLGWAHALLSGIGNKLFHAIFEQAFGP